MISKKQNGNSLVIVLAATSVLATALIVVSNKITLRAKAIQFTQLNSARDQLHKNLRQIIISPSAIMASTFGKINSSDLHPGNIELANCINQNGDADCTATGVNTFVGFELFDEHRTQYTSSWPAELRIMELDLNGKWPSALTRFDGLILPQPQFDKNLKRCSSSATCSLTPFTAFRAWCPQTRSNQNFTILQKDEQGIHNNLVARSEKCDVAEYIQFFIAVGGTTYGSATIAVGPGTQPMRTKHSFFVSSPSELGAKTREPEEILIAVSEIATNGAQLCPDGMSTVGLDSNGRPRCEFETNPCVVNGDAGKGFIIAAYENGELVCRKPFQGESCDPLEVFYGVDENDKLICKRPKFNAGCKQDEIVVSFDENGEPKCIRAHTNQVCPQPAILVGFDANGLAVCKIAETMFAGIAVTPTWQ